MSEIKREVKTYKITYGCDECKIGEFEPTGLSNSAGYSHRCNVCFKDKMLKDVYPKIVYEEAKSYPSTIEELEEIAGHMNKEKKNETNS